MVLPSTELSSVSIATLCKVAFSILTLSTPFSRLTLTLLRTVELTLSLSPVMFRSSLPRPVSMLVKLTFAPLLIFTVSLPESVLSSTWPSPPIDILPMTSPLTLIMSSPLPVSTLVFLVSDTNLPSILTVSTPSLV